MEENVVVDLDSQVDQPTAISRNAAIAELGPFLTMTNVSMWNRAVGRVIGVGPAELHFHCAAYSLIRLSKQEDHTRSNETTDVSLQQVAADIVSAARNMKVPHIKALCLLACGIPYNHNDFLGARFLFKTSIRISTNRILSLLRSISSGLVLAFNLSSSTITAALPSNDGSNSEAKLTEDTVRPLLYFVNCLALYISMLPMLPASHQVPATQAVAFAMDLALGNQPQLDNIVRICDLTWDHIQSAIATDNQDVDDVAGMFDSYDKFSRAFLPGVSSPDSQGCWLESKLATLFNLSLDQVVSCFHHKCEQVYEEILNPEEALLKAIDGNDALESLYGMMETVIIAFQNSSSLVETGIPMLKRSMMTAVQNILLANRGNPKQSRVLSIYGWILLTKLETLLDEAASSEIAAAIRQAYSNYLCADIRSTAADVVKQINVDFNPIVAAVERGLQQPSELLALLSQEVPKVTNALAAASPAMKTDSLQLFIKSISIIIRFVHESNNQHASDVIGNSFDRLAKLQRCPSNLPQETNSCQLSTAEALTDRRQCWLALMTLALRGGSYNLFVDIMFSEFNDVRLDRLNDVDADSDSVEKDQIERLVQLVQELPPSSIQRIQVII